MKFIKRIKQRFRRMFKEERRFFVKLEPVCDIREVYKRKNLVLDPDLMFTTKLSFDLDSLDNLYSIDEKKLLELFLNGEICRRPVVGIIWQLNENCVSILYPEVPYLVMYALPGNEKWSFLPSVTRLYEIKLI